MLDGKEVVCDCEREKCNYHLIDSEWGYLLMHHDTITRISRPRFFVTMDCAEYYIQKHKIPETELSNMDRSTAGHYKGLNRGYLRRLAKTVLNLENPQP